jgi:hypothetical protein
MKYSIDISYEAYGFESKSSKINKIIRTGTNFIFGGGTTRVKISDYIETGKDSIVGSMIYNIFELVKYDKQIQNGDILPEWVYFWLRLCKGILNLSDKDELISALLVPEEKKIYELDGHELCSQIGSNSWTMGDYGVMLLWGVKPSYSRCFDIKKLRFIKTLQLPVQCRGAIFPMVDGCGIGWSLNFEDGKRIGIPIEALKESYGYRKSNP